MIISGWGLVEHKTCLGLFVWNPYVVLHIVDLFITIGQNVQLSLYESNAGHESSCDPDTSSVVFLFEKIYLYSTLNCSELVSNGGDSNVL